MACLSFGGSRAGCASGYVWRPGILSSPIRVEHEDAVPSLLAGPIRKHPRLDRRPRTARARTYKFCQRFQALLSESLLCPPPLPPLSLGPPWYGCPSRAAQRPSPPIFTFWMRQHQPPFRPLAMMRPSNDERFPPNLGGVCADEAQGEGHTASARS